MVACPRSKISSAFATISSTFQRRPMPSYPQANIPSSGPIKFAPRALRVSTFCCVAGCNHIFPFIAGATRTGACVASAMEVRASSQIPSASLASTLAVAGATRKRSARSARSICVGRQDSRSSKTRRDHRIFRQGLECHRGDKTRRVFRHDNEDHVSAFHKFAGEVSGFVGGDGASDAKDD